MSRRRRIDCGIKCRRLVILFGRLVESCEPSLHIPFIVYDPRPNAAKGIVSDKIVLNMDVAPTLLDLAGVDIPEVMDGVSLLPLIEPTTNNQQLSTNNFPLARSFLLRALSLRCEG